MERPMDRGERLNAMCDEICRGIRHKSADDHIEAMQEVADVIGIPRPTAKEVSDARYHFLSGFDEAIAMDREELLEENQDLHAMVMHLCNRLMVRRCEKCRGHGGLENDVIPCDCDEGWVENTTDEPERFVREIRNPSP